MGNFGFYTCLWQTACHVLLLITDREFFLGHHNLRVGKIGNFK